MSGLQEEVEAGAFDERRHVTASELRTMSPASVLARAAADEAVRDAFGDVFDALDADDDLRRSTGVAVGMVGPFPTSTRREKNPLILFLESLFHPHLVVVL